MRRSISLATLLLASTFLVHAKKIVSPDTSAANEKVDLEATITLDQEQVQHLLGADPGPGIVLVRVKVTPKVDAPMYISPDDFVLLAYDDGERSKPFTPSEIAGDGAMVVRRKTKATGKTGVGAELGGLMSGSGSSPGNTAPVTVDAKMEDKKAGDAKLLEVLNSKQFPTKTTNEQVEGYLYFPLQGKHKLKNLEVMYKGDGGKLTMKFQQ